MSFLDKTNFFVHKMRHYMFRIIIQLSSNFLLQYLQKSHIISLNFIRLNWQCCTNLTVLSFEIS